MAFLSIVFLTITIANLVISSPTFDGVIKIPKGCEDELLCTEKPDNYPDFENHVYAMQDNDFMKTPQYEGEPLYEDMPVYDDENCNIIQRIIKPYVVRPNMTATTKLVVQTKSYQQRVKETRCMNEGDQCFNEFYRPGYVAKCVPTMGSVQLHLYDTDTKQFEYGSFEIPMCCSCGIFRTDNYK